MARRGGGGGHGDDGRAERELVEAFWGGSKAEKKERKEGSKEGRKEGSRRREEVRVGGGKGTELMGVEVKRKRRKATKGPGTRAL